MSTPIVESIGSFIESAIGDITEENDFNYTLTPTRRKRQFLMSEAYKDLTAYIFQGESERNGKVINANAPRVIIQEYFIWVCCLQSDTSNEVIDTKLNVVRSDIEKKLCEDPTCGGFAKHLDIISAEPTDEPDTGVLLVVDVHYAVVWRDPYTKA